MKPKTNEQSKFNHGINSLEERSCKVGNRRYRWENLSEITDSVQIVQKTQNNFMNLSIVFDANELRQFGIYIVKFPEFSPTAIIIFQSMAFSPTELRFVHDNIIIIRFNLAFSSGHYSAVMMAGNVSPRNLGA